MPAKKPPPIVADTTGVYIKLPNLPPDIAASVATLFASVGAIVGAARDIGEHGARLEGHVTRAIAKPRRRARRR